MRARCIEVNIIEDSGTLTIVNGVPQINRIALAKCPNCDSVLCNFGTIDKEADVLKFCTEHQDELLKRIRYCCRCGQEIFYPSIVEEEDEEK